MVSSVIVNVMESGVQAFIGKEPIVEILETPVLGIQPTIEAPTVWSLPLKKAEASVYVPAGKVTV